MSVVKLISSVEKQKAPTTAFDRTYGVLEFSGPTVLPFDIVASFLIVDRWMFIISLLLFLSKISSGARNCFIFRFFK